MYAAFEGGIRQIMHWLLSALGFVAKLLLPLSGSSGQGGSSTDTLVPPNLPEGGGTIDPWGVS